MTPSLRNGFTHPIIHSLCRILFEFLGPASGTFTEVRYVYSLVNIHENEYITEKKSKTKVRCKSIRHSKLVKLCGVADRGESREDAWSSANLKDTNATQTDPATIAICCCTINAAASGSSLYRFTSHKPVSLTKWHQTCIIPIKSCSASENMIMQLYT